MPGRSITVLFVLVLPLAFVACGEPGELSSVREESVERSDTPETTRLAGETVSYSGPREPIDEDRVLDSLDRKEPVKGLGANLVFAHGELSGNVGCGDFILPYRLGDDELRFTREEISDYECGKPKPVRRQEAEFLDVMRNLSSVRVTNQRLELTDKNGKVLVFVQPEPPPLAPALEGTEWNLVSLNGEAPVEGTRLTPEIGEDSLGGYFGCNGGGGEFEVMDGGRLELNEVMQTDVGCAGERGRQERAYSAALLNASTYRLRGDRLELGNDEGEAILVHTRNEQRRSDPDDLIGTQWKLRTFNGEPPDKDYTPFISFDTKTRFTGYDGCLPVGGTYEAGSEDLYLGLDESNGYCMKPEDWPRERPLPLGSSLFEEAIGEGKEYRLVDGRLEMRSDDGDFYVFVPLREGEKVERSGSAWVLEKFVEQGRSVPSLGGNEPTLKFDRGFQDLDSGEVSGSTGCNTYTAGYLSTGEGLDVGSVVATEMSCAGAIMEQERSYLDFLEDVTVAYHHTTGRGPNSGTRLHLEAKDGRALIFAGPE